MAAKDYSGHGGRGARGNHGDHNKHNGHRKPKGSSSHRPLGTYHVTKRHGEDGHSNNGKINYSDNISNFGGSRGPGYQGRNFNPNYNPHINGRQAGAQRTARGWNPTGKNASGNGSGNGYHHSMPQPEPAIRILSAKAGRASKATGRTAFGSTFRGDGKDSRFTPDQLHTAEAKPFSSAQPGMSKDDPSLQEERERIRRYLLASYTSLRHDTPNLGYLVEMCLNSPERDLHEVIRTHAFFDLMQYGDMEHIAAEMLHFYVGISQCRAGHGHMVDDIVMCDCDGRVPMCFIVAFTSLLRDYLELKQSCEKAQGLLYGIANPTVMGQPYEEDMDCSIG